MFRHIKDHLIILNVDTDFKNKFQHLLRKTHGGEKKATLHLQEMN